MCVNVCLETRHKFHYNLVSFRAMSYAAVAIEILLVVETYVADERLLQTQRHAAGQSRALIVVHDEFALRVRLAVGVSSAVAVVAHVVVAHEWRD